MSKLRSISALLSGVTAMLVLISVGLCALFALGAYERTQTAAKTLEAVSLKRNMFGAWDCARTEIGAERAAYSARKQISPEALSGIMSIHGKCDGKVSFVIDEMKAQSVPGLSRGIQTLLERQEQYRQRTASIFNAIRNPAATRAGALEVSWTTAVDDLTAEVARQSKLLTNQLASDDLYIRELLAISDLAWNMRADAGVDRRYLGDVLRRDNPSPNLAGLDEMQGRISANWSNIFDGINMELMPGELRRALAKANTTYFGTFLAKRSAILNQLRRGNRVVMSRQEILNISNEGIGSLAATSSLALDLTAERAKLAARNSYRHLLLSLAAMLLSVILALCTSAYLIRRIIRPLKQITQTMRAVVEGDLERNIPYDSRDDEIGQFAHSLRLFRDTALSRQKMEMAVLESQAAARAAENSNRVKSEFLANMSHELRTPLNAILGFSELIVSEVFGPGLAKYREYAQDIHGAGAHLLSLINDILDISKAEAGKLDLTLEAVDLPKLISECARLMRCRADQRGIRLDVSVAPVPSLRGDRLRIKQVLLNLLSNAVKFTESGGVVSIRCDVDSSGNTWVAVRDTGIGIPSDMLSAIFEPFRQVDTKLARKFEGTGLGLSLAKTLVEMHSGSISIDSELGSGTVVKVLFPSSAVEITQAA